LGGAVPTETKNSTSSRRRQTVSTVKKSQARIVLRIEDDFEQLHQG
jgi:hypothetical protein